MTVNKIIAITVFAVILTSIVSYCSPVKACEKPISDKELFKKYKPCHGGWCLR